MQSSSKMSILTLSSFLAVPPEAGEVELSLQEQELLRQKLKGKY